MLVMILADSVSYPRPRHALAELIEARVALMLQAFRRGQAADFRVGTQVRVHNQSVPNKSICSFPTKLWPSLEAKQLQHACSC